MGYDRDDSFPLDFEPNGIPFGSKSKGKLSPRSHPIQFERKWNTIFLSVACLQRVMLIGSMLQVVWRRRVRLLMYLSAFVIDRRALFWATCNYE